MRTIEDRVIAIVSKKLRRDAKEITAGASIAEDLGADSLDSVEIVMDLEDEFSLRIPDEDADRIQTIQDACDYIHLALVKSSQMRRRTESTPHLRSRG